jgi:hypothetical protein
MGKGLHSVHHGKGLHSVHVDGYAGAGSTSMLAWIASYGASNAIMRQAIALVDVGRAAIPREDCIAVMDGGILWRAALCRRAAWCSPCDPVASAQVGGGVPSATPGPSTGMHRLSRLARKVQSLDMGARRREFAWIS